MTVLASAADMSSVSYLPLYCIGSTCLVVTILASWGLFKQWRKWQYGEPWEFSSRRTVVLAVIVGLTFVLPATLFGWAVVDDYVMDSRPDLSYYTFTNGIEDGTVAFEARSIDDMDTVLFQDRVLAFFVEDNVTSLNLRVVDLDGPLGMAEAEHLVVIGESEYSLNARGTTTAIVEGDALAIYYSHIILYDGRTEKKTWRMASEDASNWSTPELVPGEPNDGPKRTDIPRTFEWYRIVEVYEHRTFRTSTGGDLLAVEYCRDMGDYPDRKGTFFAYRPRGGEWSDLVSLGYVHEVPQDVHELSDGTIVVVTKEDRDRQYYRVGTFRFGPEDFEDLTGPFYVD